MGSEMCIRDRLQIGEVQDDDAVLITGRLIGGHQRLLGEASHLTCLLYTSDAADERSSVDLGGRRIIKKTKSNMRVATSTYLSIMINIANLCNIKQL